MKYHLTAFTLTIGSKQSQTIEEKKRKRKIKRKGIPVVNEILLFVLPFTEQKNGRMNCCIFLLDLDPSGLTGLEPAASALTGRCSDQLNYNPKEITE